MSKLWIAGTALAATSILVSCGGGISDVPKDRPFIDVPVPGVAAGTNFGFDLGTVSNGKYFLTDRFNQAVDVLDVGTSSLTQIKGTGANAFTGCKPNANCSGANNALSGPDGINAIPGNLLFVGDVDSVKVVDRSSGSVVKSIRTGTTGNRADEGCFDPDDNIYMISTPEASTPFATFISTTSQTVIATVNFNDPTGGPTGVSAGLEQCAYDAGTKSFLVNNDGTAANPHGEVNVIPAASIKALAAGSTTFLSAVANVKSYPLGNCDPTGLDLGPGTDMIVECREGDAGASLITIIMNRANGAILATLAVGGGDAVAYDARTNRYFVAASRWHASGINEQGGNCSATNLCTPVLAVIDAGTKTVTAKIPTGNNSHSVAVDPETGRVFVPYSSATSPAGCATCAANNFISGGISIFTP